RIFSDDPQWVNAENLTSNHFVGMHMQKTNCDNNQDDNQIDKELAYILGRYVADGHLRKTKRKGRKDSYQYQVVLSIGAKKLKEFQKKVKTYHFSCYPHTKSVYRCVFSSQELLSFIKVQGFGEGAINKNIPEIIYKQSIDVQNTFLEGYIDGDGCYIESESKYSMATVSPKLAFGLQRLITGLWATNAFVSISNNNRTHEIDGREIKANYPLYTICAKREMRKQTVAHIQGGIMWTQVKSVRSTEREEKVYNIEVAEDNSYTVNNCIVHNCTYWSIAQSPDKRETTASGIGWELFSQYVRALHEAEPKFFIYENNKSMSAAIRQSITETFGFEAICINSALVSAQNRQRLYWVGKRNADGTYSKVDVQQPEDRGILLKDALDGADLTNCDKAYCLTSSYDGACAWNTIERHQRSMVAESVCIASRGRYSDADSRSSKTDAPTYQHYEARTDSKTNAITTVSKDNLIGEPVRCFTLPREDGVQTQSKQYRVYETSGKSTTLCAEGGGMGAKTGLYAVPLESGKELTENEMDYMVRGHSDRRWNHCQRPKQDEKAKCLVANISKGVPYNVCAIPVEFNGEIPVKAVSGADGKTYTVYEVKDSNITIKGKTYPIKLIDGYYIIRKLTVSECKRLQTVPEWYEFPVSDTQAYKMLGNGFTINVIAHLIEATIKNKEY
ncbi:MAG: DNA cytosine methyltransferase, partial [Clostridia bacterium]|nr:DNA cytosine methyltransferase [Clostridia bacterium]